jgi:hypothetical protein
MPLSQAGLFMSAQRLRLQVRTVSFRHPWEIGLWK